MKSLKYLILSILSLSIASVGYAAMADSTADYTKPNQKGGVLKDKPLTKIIIGRDIKKRYCAKRMGACGGGEAHTTN